MLLQSMLPLDNEFHYISLFIIQGPEEKMDYALYVYYISLFIDMDCVVAADITFM